MTVALFLFSAAAFADQIGIASWYGDESGSVTASGERFRPSSLTAAHRTLPFGTKLRVSVLGAGRSCIVRVNDRGPARWTGRLIDLSRGAAEACGFRARGTARVRITIIR